MIALIAWIALVALIALLAVIAARQRREKREIEFDEEAGPPSHGPMYSVSVIPHTSIFTGVGVEVTGVDARRDRVLVSNRVCASGPPSALGLAA